MKRITKRLAAIAVAAPIALLGGAALAMPANAAPAAKAPNAASVEAKAKSAEFKSLVKEQNANAKAAGNSKEAKEDRKDAIQSWLDVNRRGIVAEPEPEVEAPVEEAPQLPSDPVVVGPIDSPTRPPIQVGG